MENHKLALGTVQFGVPYGVSNSDGQTAPCEVTRILKYAEDNDINFLDTASAYGNAEFVLGNNNLTAFNIISKFITTNTTGSIGDQVQKSLLNLHIKSLYGYLAHRPAELLNDSSQWKILKDLKLNGLVKKIGFSLNSPEELKALLNKNLIPDLIQVPYNYVDNRFEELIIKMKNKGCEVHARSVFLQGLFFKDVNTLSSFFDPIKPLIIKLQSNTDDIAGALLRYVIEKPFIDKVIIGVENLKQLQTNIKNLDTNVQLEQVKTIVPSNILTPFNWPKQTKY